MKQPPWQDPAYRTWTFPKQVPDNLLAWWKEVNDMRKRYPEVWRLGGTQKSTVLWNQLCEIMERGWFLEIDKAIIHSWQMGMRRHRKDFKAPGVVAMMRYLGIVEKGKAHMIKTVLRQQEAINEKAVRGIAKGVVNLPYYRLPK
jgi:hypothetical protein